jgi:hypothetical protein
VKRDARRGLNVAVFCVVVWFAVAVPAYASQIA